jgi:hypothetical protein
MRTLLPLAIALCLTGCADGPPAGAAPGAPTSTQLRKDPAAVPRPPVEKLDVSDACGAARLMPFIGKPVATPGVPAASRSTPAVRYLFPNTIVTMDFSEQRLNIELDAQGVILRARCG